MTCSSHKFVVIYDHRETLCGVLTDKRFYDGESLTGTGSADHPCTTERIADVNPTFTKLALVIIAHGDIDRVFVFL